MSQAFVNSILCKEEFEQCYIENMNNPVFQLFVIMMQPADTLENLTESMKTFFAQRTYPEKDDPNMILKITEYLTEVKKPEADDNGSNNKDTNDNNHSIMANNANMFQYHVHNNDSIVNNDVDGTDNDVNSVNEQDNEQDHGYPRYNASIQLADVGIV